MKSLRLLLLMVAGCIFISSAPASAQGAAPAYMFPKQFSADQIMTTKDGASMTSKVYMDNGKIRSEINSNGMQMVAIIRFDQLKVYSILVARKMVMVTPLDPIKAKQMMPPGAGGDAKVEAVGPDTLDGVAATKYKITGDNGKVVFLWVDTAKQIPLKAASEDGVYSAVYRNFQTGPQDAALFEPPAGYQVMTMPGAPSSPSGGP